jgi:hypothetical protein
MKTALFFNKEFKEPNRGYKDERPNLAAECEILAPKVLSSKPKNYFG